MPEAELKTRVLLLVEDNPADADLVRAFLEDPMNGHAEGPTFNGQYELHHVPRLSEALQDLMTYDVDVILLDLRLPDANGIDGVRAIREAEDNTPIVVLTGAENEELALECIEAGAQDYLNKGEMKAIALRRAIGYALSRRREAQIHELQQTLERFRALSSEASDPADAPSLAAQAPIRERAPEAFEQLLDGYVGLLNEYLDQLMLTRGKPRRTMEAIASKLGDAGAAARDMVDLHVAGLDRALEGQRDKRAHAILINGRLLALEMMGLLVDYYRLGPQLGRTSATKH